MKRFAIIENQEVVNVAIASSPLADNWVDLTDMTPEPGVGWGYVDGVFIAPPEPEPVTPTYKSRPAFDFYRKFTSAERIAIRERAKTDVIAEDIYATLNAAIASGSNVRDDDPDTTNGLAYLESVGVLATGRAAEILQ